MPGSMETICKNGSFFFDAIPQYYVTGLEEQHAATASSTSFPGNMRIPLLDVILRNHHLFRQLKNRSSDFFSNSVMEFSIH